MLTMKTTLAVLLGTICFAGWSGECLAQSATGTCETRKIMVTPRSALQYPEYQVQGSGSYTYPAGNHVTYRVKVLIERVTPGNVADITQVIQNGTTNPVGGTVNVPLDWTMVATPPVGGDLYRVTVVGTIYGANQVGISTTLYQTVNVSLVP